MRTLDYSNILDLMFIAGYQVWYNPYGDGSYDSDALSGSESTWERFFELVDMNGGKNAMTAYLSDNFDRVFPARKRGANIYYPQACAYPDWDSYVEEMLEFSGRYPLYPDMLRKTNKQLEGDPRYAEYMERASRLIDDLAMEYNI